MRANLMLKTNIDTLLKRRGQTRKDLADWCGRGEGWISKIYTNANREIPLKYLDRIADFFGLATYQLFQPGISPLTERRSGRERRSDKDRRVSKAQRNMMALANEVDAHRPQRKGTSDASPTSLHKLFAEIQKEFDRLLSKGVGEAARTGTTLPKARPRLHTAAQSNRRSTEDADE